jgi:hypothetical protein
MGLREFDPVKPDPIARFISDRGKLKLEGAVCCGIPRIRIQCSLPAL